MVFIFDFYPELDFAVKAILGTAATIIFLILVELLEVNHDSKDIKEIFSPLIVGLIITFIFIVINKIIEILR